MAEKEKLNISASVHPEYFYKYKDWEKFRYVWEGGTDFRDTYLESYSAREDDDDFLLRKKITPIPGFASAAVTDIKNAIFQRMNDIMREGGSPLYQQIIAGKLGGTDLLGATMNYFVGNEILPELLFMGKIGVYTDMPIIEIGENINQTKSTHPYFYTYKTEDIRNWRLSKHGEFIEFDMLLLRETILTYDDVYSLPEKDSVRFRLLTRQDGVVIVRFFDTNGTQIDTNGEPTNEITELNISRIPFTLLELKRSLLQDIADHQIALLNIESSDIGYTLLSNFPFYTEQQSKMVSPHLKGEGTDQVDVAEIEVGGTIGRSYAKGMDRPDFIHPSSEPLVASMAKQKQIKEDIRTLVQLALSTVQPKYASAEAKQFDEHGLESGLSFIGLILEHSERQLASFFNEYENTNEVATINYPDHYSLKTDSERLNEADKLHKMLLKIPSKTGQKVMSKLIARKLLDTKIPQDQLEIIFKEIEDAEYITTDPEIIADDIEKGLVSTKTASKARGYNADKEVPQAQKEHAERVKRIQDSQTPKVDDLEIDNNAAKLEKSDSQNTDLQGNAHKPIRGKDK